MNQEQVIKKYAGTEKDFTGRSFRGSHWVDKTFIGGIYQQVDFSHSYLDCSSFNEADLSWAQFIRVSMYETGFENCHMEGTDFSWADLGECNFSNVNLSRARFRNATFSQTSFKNANLSYADLTGARKFDSCVCQGTIFYETIMPDGNIRSDKNVS